MELKNPYAYVGEKLVTAVSAERKGDFRCPSCKESLILKRGEIKTPHFAHMPDMEKCTRDLITHQIAIDLLCKQSFSYEYECRGEFDYDSLKGSAYRSCKHSEIRTIGGNANRRTEHPIDKYIADIAILSNNGKVRGVIEVAHTHDTEKEKWAYFNENKIPCVEVEAQSVIDVYQLGNRHIECMLDNLHLFRDCQACKIAQKAAQVDRMVLYLPFIKDKQRFGNRVKELWKLPILDNEALEAKCEELSYLRSGFLP